MIVPFMESVCALPLCLCLGVCSYENIYTKYDFQRSQCFNLWYVCSRDTNCYHFRMPNETCSFNNRFKSLSGIHLVPGIWQPTYQRRRKKSRDIKLPKQEWEKEWEWWRSIEEFILFTFCRNPVMIASYKIDEICHKNEDVCFYVCVCVCTSVWVSVYISRWVDLCVCVSECVYKSRFSVSIFLGVFTFTYSFYLCQDTALFITDLLGVRASVRAFVWVLCR